MKKRIVSFLLALVMAVSLLPVSAFAADGVYTVAKDAKSPVSTFAAEDAPFTVLAPTGAAVEKTGRTEEVEWTWCEGEELENPQTRYAEVDVWTVTVPEKTQSLKLRLSDTTKYHAISTTLPSEDDIRMFVNMDYPEAAIGGSWDSEAQAYQVDKLPACTKGDAPITVWNNDYWGIPTLRIYVKFAPAEPAPFVLKADGQAVAVEKTPITGYDCSGDTYTVPVYKATIYETASRIAFDVANKKVLYVDNWDNNPKDPTEPFEVAKLVDCAMIGNNDITFILEGNLSITDVIDTTAKKTSIFFFTDLSNDYFALILEIKEDPAPAEDENAPVVAGATLERITGSVYGSATNVYLAKLPADAAQFSVTLQSDEFVVTGNLFHAENYTSYASQAYLDSTDWYNSLDAVMEDLRAYNGYKSVEEMLKYYDGGYSSKEDLLKRGCGCETPAAFWDETCTFVKCETTTLTMQTDNLAAMKASTFNGLFSSSSVKFDPTVAFRLLEVHTDSSILKNDDCPGYGEGNPRSVLLLQFGEPTPLDRTALQAAIDAAPKAEDGKYYTSGDRYNGKAADTILNDKNVGWDGSFWKEYQKALAGAQSALTNADSQAKLDAAAAALQAAIAKLIPTDRVNATALYETVTGDWVWYGKDITNRKNYVGQAAFLKDVTAENTTPASLTAYRRDIAAGEALLETLYDENGVPTDSNKPAAQAEIDRLAQAPKRLVFAETYAELMAYYEAHKAEARTLLTQYDPAKLKEGDYTPESWKAYTAAYAALKADMAYTPGAAGSYEDYLMLRGFYGYYGNNEAGEWTHFEAHIDALKTARRQLASRVDVTVSFTYINNFAALYPSIRESGTELYVNSALTLSGGSTTLTGAVEAAGIRWDRRELNELPNSTYNDCDTNPYLAVFVNGESYGFTSLSMLERGLDTTQLHQGDQVRLVRVATPMSRHEASSGYDSTQIFTGFASNASEYQSSIAQIHMTAPARAKVGDKVSVSATVTCADVNSLGQSRSPAGITLFISAPSETEALGQPIYKTAAVTGEDGNLQYVFTQPGWYTVAMFNVTPDKLTFTSVYNEVTLGEYYSLYGGDYAMVYVAEADDTAALLKQYRAEKAAEAKAYFDGFHDYDFTAEGYAAFKAQYDALTAHLDAAEDLTLLMGGFDADFARLKELGAAAIDHASVIAGLRKNLNYLPGDLNDLNANDHKRLVQDIQTTYAALNGYQRKLLSANEIKRLDEVAKINADELKAVAEVTVNVTVEGTRLPSWSGTGGAANKGWPCITWSVRPNLDGKVIVSNLGSEKQTPQGAVLKAKAGDHVFIRRYMPNHTDEQYWLVGSLDGGKTWDLARQQTLSYQGADYPDYYLLEYVVPADVADGGTMDIKLKTISKQDYEEQSGDTLLAVRQAAISRLKTLYDSLGSKAQEAYDEGVKNINAASSAVAIDRLYQAAAVAMREAANNYGKVHVIVENTTFTSDMWPEGKEYWDGQLVNEWIDLNADSTMMNCIVAALANKGYEQEGAESNYIATINGLSQMDGGDQSGWMGTLNDWFTNEGFAAFTVANGKLADGDVIRVMYTREGLGADLGGTWGSSDTTIKALEIQGGKLASAFTPGEAGGLYEYTLTIEGENADLRLTPTASNKNFLTKIFLNEKVTDRSEGSSFYKRTESIPVKAGDTIYVGCGARAWPTMNNQAGNTQESDGTWYVLRVVNANAGAAYVDELIDALPKAAAVTYASYQKIAEAAAAARSALDALSKSEQAKADALKLEKVEAAIAQFKAIDDAKAKIDALPEAGKVTLAERDVVKAAQDAYDALTAEQKDYLTFAQSAKVTTLSKRIAELEAVPIKSVEELIDAIGEVTLDSKSAIDEARAAYDKLTAEQQAKVSNYAALTAAETAYAKLAADKADQDAADAVIAKINAIGTVTLDSKKAIDAARKAYDGLTKAQQARVSNYAALTAAETTYAKLVADKADQDAADAVIAKIDAIGTVTLDSKKAIDAARKAYDKLTAAQQAKVSNYATLTAAETTYAKLVADKADQDAADAVIAKIDAIGTVTLDSKKAIDAARKAYDKLTAAQQARVSNYAALIAAETTYAKLVQDKADQDAADAVIAKINAIGVVSRAAKSRIDAARKAYDGLTDAQKALVPASVVKTLTDAETAYSNLPPRHSSDDTADSTKPAQSSRTGDAGIAIYAAMSLLSVTGGAWVIGKKRKH